MKARKEIQIQTLHLFHVLDELLLDLLRSLRPEQWQWPTIAKRWTVKDIAAHLLDGNLRALSISRDHYEGETIGGFESYGDLVAHLNARNAIWTDAAKGLSPEVLMELLAVTGPRYMAHLMSLPPHDAAVFSVAWAGEEQSANWFHIAREYTEKFLHQQQIREAVGSQRLMTRELYHPFIDTLMRGLPHTYRHVEAPVGAAVAVHVRTELGGVWTVVKGDHAWQLSDAGSLLPVASVYLDPETAWKLFSKGIRPDEAIDRVEISGDRTLGQIALQMVSVMA